MLFFAVHVVFSLWPTFLHTLLLLEFYGLSSYGRKLEIVFVQLTLSNKNEFGHGYKYKSKLSLIEYLTLKFIIKIQKIVCIGV